MEFLHWSRARWRGRRAGSSSAAPRHRAEPRRFRRGTPRRLARPSPKARAGSPPGRGAGVSVPRHPRGTIRHLRGGRRAWTITRTISSPRPDRARTRPATRAYTRTMTPPPRRGTPRRTARRWRFRSEEANHRSAKRTRSATARPSPRRRRRKPKGRKRRNRARRVAVPPSPAPAGWWSRPARTRTCCLAEKRAPALSSTRDRTRRLARSATRRMTSTRRRRRFFARSFFAERTPNERESEIKRRARVRTRAGSRA